METVVGPFIVVVVVEEEEEEEEEEDVGASVGFLRVDGVMGWDCVVG